MIAWFLLLIISFVILVKGADLFVLGAAGLGSRMKISPLIIGLTIVAFGTSAPELAVSLVASIRGQNGIAVGNVIGSNIFNILVVLGASALVSPLVIRRSLIVKDIPFMLVATAVLGLFCCDVWLSRYKVDGEKIVPSHFVLSQAEGIVLLLLFCIFFYYLISDALNKKEQQLDEVIKRNLSVFRLIIYLIAGLIAIIGGGNLVVESATRIARFFKISEEVIGLTICAIGTSLPELVTSIVAARKGENEIAIGNVVGSNIFNLLFILSISVIISPIVLGAEVVLDLLLLFGISLLVYFVSLKGKIGRVSGFLFLLFYGAYMGYLFLR